MRKLRQLSTYIQDSPGDIFLKSKKGPRPVVCTSTAELTSQALRNSPSCASFLAAFAKPRIHTTPDDLLPVDTMPKSVPSQQPSPPSRRPSSKAESERHPKRKDSSNASYSDKSSTVSYDMGTVWSLNDTFLPRAKPPPPLKMIKHKRHRSVVHSESAPSSRSSLARSQSDSSRPASRSSPALSPSPSCLPHLTLDLTILDITIENVDHTEVVSEGPPLTRSPTLVSSSDTDGSTEAPFQPTQFKSAWRWKPPPSWIGPSTSTTDLSEVVRDAPKPPRRTSSFRERIGGPKRGDLLPRTHLSAPRMLKKLRSLPLVDISDDRDKEVASEPEKPLSSGVMVLHCAEGGWQEKRVAEVIPMLRALKAK